MNSVEAFKELKENAEEICEWELDRLNIIEKDLEVLEILKKHLWFAPLSGFKYCCQDLIDLGNEEEFNKIKEWLENE